MFPNPAWCTNKPRNRPRSPHNLQHNRNNRNNRNTTRDKSNAGKVDYHNMGACYDVLGVVGLGAETG